MYVLTSHVLTSHVRATTNLWSLIYCLWSLSMSLLEAVLDDSFGSEGVSPHTLGPLSSALVGGRRGVASALLSDIKAGEGLLGDGGVGLGGDSSLEGNVVVLRALQDEAAGVIQQGVRAHQARQTLTQRRQAAKVVRDEAEAFLVTHITQPTLLSPFLNTPYQ